MKLTLAEIDQQIKEIVEAQKGLNEAARQLHDERLFLLNQSKRKPVTSGIAKSLNGAGS